MPAHKKTAAEKAATLQKRRSSDRFKALKSANSRKRYAEDHVRQRKMKNEYRQKNLTKMREYFKLYQRKNRYGIEPTRPCPTECECCYTDFGEATSFKGACFDHDHRTNTFRGWICRRCNIILGNAKDSTVHLQQLMRYLDASQDDLLK